MSTGTVDDSLAAGNAALACGQWADARAAFEVCLSSRETGQARFGMAVTLWWMGENQACVDEGTRAYALFRRSGEVASAVHCAVWLGITYKANFANFAAANGWLGRADRLLKPLAIGPLHGWLWVARAYRLPDLDAAEALTARAAELARSGADTDLELVAMSQLGLIRVRMGQVGAGFALIDEAMAAALAGERSSLDTVVYTCCDMLNACELASDIERAAQWCQVADDFVNTYGCPFLYAECRIFYGSVLAAKGRWAEAERELNAGLRITEGACPGLHDRALIRLASLRTRQGRLEEAEALLSDLGDGIGAENDAALSRAALLLARGDSAAASRSLEQRLHHLVQRGSDLASAIELLVDAYRGPWPAADRTSRSGTAGGRWPPSTRSAPRWTPIGQRHSFARTAWPPSRLSRRAAERASDRSPHARSRCCGWSERDCPTPRSPGGSMSVARPLPTT